VVATDGSWRVAAGPLVYSDLLMGERYDARRALPGWSEPGYEDAGWNPVATRARDEASLVPARAQPIRVTEELRPVAVTERAPGVHVFDLGQNLVGWVRLSVEGERGTRVQMQFAEMLEPDGSLYLDNLRSARPRDTYVLRGGGPESFEPRFTFHGFRYVEVTGLPDEPTLDTLTGCVVHSDTPRSGWFECSDAMVNQLWRNIDWGQRGNFLSVPTDCPQRDERLGWLADAQVFLPTATLNMDVAAFMTKWGDDVLDAQMADGAYPDVAPRVVFKRGGAPAWADAGVIVPWVLWQRYGDTRLLERHWDAMERYMAYLLRHNPDLLWTVRRGNDYGDWLSVGAHTPRDVLATAYWAHDAKLMADMARALGRDDRAEHYERLRSGVVTAFNRAYVREAPTSRATPRRSTCSRCTWTSSLKISARERPSDWWRTSSATTSTSPPASSASGSCARC
jgi:alpha-L-rhamnosidase